MTTHPPFYSDSLYCIIYYYKIKYKPSLWRHVMMTDFMSSSILEVPSTSIVLECAPTFRYWPIRYPKPITDPNCTSGPWNKVS
jgi:hypothetical protein